MCLKCTKFLKINAGNSLSARISCCSKSHVFTHIMLHAASLAICSHDLHRTQRVLPCVGWGVTDANWIYRL